LGDKLEAMRLFCRCAEMSSISAAAREAGLAQSQVSRAVKTLERSFGATLLARTTRSVKLTAEGEIAIVHFRDALDAVDRARDATRGDTPSGLLRVTAPVGYGHSVVAPVVRQFLAAAPGARADLDLTDSFVDLAAALGPVCAPQDLAGLPGLSYSSWRVPGAWRFARGEEQVTVRIAGRFSSTHLASLLSAAREGLGIANLPLWLVGEDLATGRLQALLEDWQVADQPINAVLPPGRHIPARTRVFLDLLKRAVRAPRPGP